MPEPTLPDRVRAWIEREAADGTDTIAYKISHYQAELRRELHRVQNLLSLALGTHSLVTAGKGSCGRCGHPEADHDNPATVCTRRECYGDPHAYGPAIVLVPVSTLHSLDLNDAHHFYLSTGCLSTGCLHGRHDYCKDETGLLGGKQPAECKFCSSPCVCPCHREDG